MKGRDKWPFILSLAALLALFAWWLQPAVPTKGPMRYDIEPLQKRLALEGGTTFSPLLGLGHGGGFLFFEAMCSALYMSVRLICFTSRSR